MGWWLPLGENWPRLLITAGLIGAVSLLEAISIAKALAEVNGDHVNADQELLGELQWAFGPPSQRFVAMCICPLLSESGYHQAISVISILHIDVAF